MTDGALAGRTPLDQDDWRYVDKLSLEDSRAVDRALLKRQRTLNCARHQADQALAMLETGANDGEILEVNQVCADGNYSNRPLNGLGVATEGDLVGYCDGAETG